MKHIKELNEGFSDKDKAAFLRDIQEDLKTFEPSGESIHNISVDVENQTITIAAEFETATFKMTKLEPNK